MGQFVRNRACVGEYSAGTAPPADPKFAEGNPATWEYLSMAVDEAGHQLRRMTITIFVEGGAWKASCNDRDNRRTGWVSSSTFVGLWKAIEAGLASDKLDWRSQEGKPPKRA